MRWLSLHHETSPGQGDGQRVLDWYVSDWSHYFRNKVYMGDLKHPVAIWSKGLLFLVLGVTASTLLLMESPSVRIAIFLFVAIWAFCRFYYFTFYVIEHYVDSNYRFSGLFSFVLYALGRRSVIVASEKNSSTNEDAAD